MDSLQSLQALLGTWHHVAPWDSDDYLTEYVVSVENGAPAVAARDLNDNEAFVISAVSWDGAVLRFRSLMPSTGREGLNEFRVAANGEVECRFTFTVVEQLHRVVV